MKVEAGKNYKCKNGFVVHIESELGPGQAYRWVGYQINTGVPDVRIGMHKLWRLDGKYYPARASQWDLEVEMVVVKKWRWPNPDFIKCKRWKTWF